jgi:hypothetical protein
VVWWGKVNISFHAEAHSNDTVSVVSIWEISYLLILIIVLFQEHGKQVLLYMKWYVGMWNGIRHMYLQLPVEPQFISFSEGLRKL